MCMSNKGYDNILDLLKHVMGFQSWLQDQEPVEPNNTPDGHYGGMNFTIPWTNGDKTRMSVRYNFVGSYDVQINNFVEYQQTVFQVENDLSREQMLNLFANLYEEIRVQSSMVLEDLDFDVTKETKDIIKKLNNPYS